MMELEKVAHNASREHESSQMAHSEVCDPSSVRAKPIQPARWTEKEERIITEPYEYLTSHPGKDIRKQILHACNLWLKVDPCILEVISCSVSMLHNASLLIDDIQDNSDLRRGYPVAHRVYGIAQTINAANHMYFLAQEELMKLDQYPCLARIFNEELLNLHRGQGMDLYWRDTFTLPTEEEYLLMVSNKTGGLFRLGSRLLQAVSPTDVDLVPLADTLGLVFQIQDDYQNLTSAPMAEAKGYCEDLSEGKFSFPVIHAIRHSTTDNNEIRNILKCRPESIELKKHAVSYMTDITRSMQYTRDVVERLRERGTVQLQAISPRNPALEAILARILAT